MITFNALLSGVPAGLRTPLLESFQEIATNYIEGRWEPSELNGGKFCEVVYSIIQGVLTGTFPATASKPKDKDMATACRALENQKADPTRVGDESLRVLIPKMLLPLYEIRNKRGVGHTGGDVNPNFLDATAVYSMASWVLAELIRIFHGSSTKEAQEAVDTLIERKNRLIWEFEDIRRVLDPSMGAKDQALVLLHSKSGWVAETELCRWVEYSGLSMFIKRVLAPLHKARLIEHDKGKSRVRLSPLGVADVESKLLKLKT